MADCMNFPNDWHDFLNGYSFQDNEEIYTNGSYLIPVFRVEQLIEHLLVTQKPIVYCKDCKHRPIDNRTKEHSSNFNIDFPDYHCPCQCDDGYYSWYPEDNWFCANGEKSNE